MKALKLNKCKYYLTISQKYPNKINKFLSYSDVVDLCNRMVDERNLT